MNPQSLAGKIYALIGIAQRHLAFYIGAKQSTLSRYEEGIRTLPAEAMLQMAGLHQAVTQLPTAPLAKPTVDDKKKLLETAAWCRMQRYPLQKQLDYMQQSYAQAHNLLKMLSRYVSTHKPITEKEVRWVEEQRYQAERRMVRNGWMPQQQLIMQLAGLENEASLCEAAAQQI